MGWIEVDGRGQYCTLGLCGIGCFVSDLHFLDEPFVCCSVASQSLEYGIEQCAQDPTTPRMFLALATSFRVPRKRSATRDTEARWSDIPKLYFDLHFTLRLNDATVGQRLTFPTHRASQSAVLTRLSTTTKQSDLHHGGHNGTHATAENPAPDHAGRHGPDIWK